jgi:hypothetical protein
MHREASQSEFLAPQLVKATIEERIPRGINIERLRDPDSDRSRQFQDLGINPKLHQSFSVNFLRSSAAMVPARKRKQCVSIVSVVNTETHGVCSWKAHRLMKCDGEKRMIDEQLR